MKKGGLWTACLACLLRRSPSTCLFFFVVVVMVVGKPWV
jgi:hypothetical protein